MSFFLPEWHGIISSTSPWVIWENKVQVFLRVLSKHCGVFLNNSELHSFISPVLMLILLMSGPSWNMNLEGLCCPGLSVVLGTDRREHPNYVFQVFGQKQTWNWHPWSFMVHLTFSKLGVSKATLRSQLNGALLQAISFQMEEVNNVRSESAIHCEPLFCRQRKYL